MQHGLIQRDRIFTVSVLIPDKPGELVRVASIIAENQGNVIKLDHNQFISTNRYAAVELKVTMEAYGTEHKKKICTGIRRCRMQTEGNPRKPVSIPLFKLQTEVNEYDTIYNGRLSESL